MRDARPGPNTTVTSFALKRARRAADVIDFGYHEVQVMEVVARAAANADAMVIGVGKGAVEGDALAEAVGLHKVQHVAEEGLASFVVRRCPDDVPSRWILANVGKKGGAPRSSGQQ